MVFEALFRTNHEWIVHSVKLCHSQGATKTYGDGIEMVVGGSNEWKVEERHTCDKTGSLPQMGGKSCPERGAPTLPVQY
jgi:hypothetical protein